MSIDQKDVERLAELARLYLAPEEVERYTGQLMVIFDHIDQLKGLDVTGVAPLSHVVPMENVTRPDEVRPGLPMSALERLAPKFEDGQFVVPKILDGA